MMKRFVENELRGWSKGELIWLSFSCLLILVLSILWGDTPLGILSAVAGVANVVCTGKGKLSAYIFGVVNSVLYALIAYDAQLYGETMLNLIYYLPMQFVGFFVWSRHMDSETNEVEKRSMRVSGRLLILAVVAMGTIFYGLFLAGANDKLPYIDAFTTVASVIALIVSVKMYTEQWLIWIAVDAVSVYMWWKDFSCGSGNMATLLMWILFLTNGIIMYVRWRKECSEEGRIL